MEKILERILAVKSDNSVASFARSLGLSQPSVHYYLSGERELSLKFIYHVCYRYHVSADWLLGFTDNRQGIATPAPDAATLAKIAALEAENAALKDESTRLKAENTAYRFALEAIGKGK